MPIQRYDAPKTKLMALIIDGILNQKLPWSLVLIGALIAVSLELCMVPSLPFAVGIYLPLQTSFPIFCGGVMRWIVDLVQSAEGRRIGIESRRAAVLGLYRRRIADRRAGGIFEFQ